MAHSVASDTNFQAYMCITYKNMASWEPVDNDPTDGDEIEEENDKWDDNLMDKLKERFNKQKYSMQH